MMDRIMKAPVSATVGGEAVGFDAVQAAIDAIAAYDPRAWYWVVAADETRRWSGADRAYVAPDDAGYAAFLARGALPSRILNEAELWGVLREQAPDCLPDEQRPTRYVRKLLILDRLVVADKFALAMAALGGPGQLAYERWQAAVDIAADDPQVRGLLVAIGADPDVILAPETV